MTQLSGPPPPPPHTGTPQRPKRLLRWLTFVFAAVLGLALIAGNAGWFWLQSRLNASLPQLDGAKAVDGLSSPVEIERDELGVPTIRASSRVDAVKALGFVHAQDRFFQMDLLRRQGAAELAEIFGPAAAQSDRQRRIHRFRDMARRTLAQLPADDRALLSAYASGVNAGVSALSEKPFEYLVLRSDLAPWQPEDSMLVFYAMFFELHDEVGRGESNLGYLHDTLPPKCSSSSLHTARNGMPR